ncbi:glycosyltransferase family 2 protein [Sinosporangium siamense]|uniref:Glycosyl transferase n=1 Tax=Sinosporangium siamense TaxID=1367973 RepID=A0A919RBS9_9ACTN|nr:glycosyltransferase [Sinosporangium siamense]GII91003.1 glycosyl transferase [Sinosporangium siamense]
MKISCVILTMGNRVAELDRAVASVLDQIDGDVEVVVVGNGADVPEITAMPGPGNSATIKVVRLPHNSGIPAGRNRGVEECSGDVILFLDDDGWYANPRVAAHVRDRFATEPDLAVVSFRVMDPDGGNGQRRHVPRLRAGNPERSSPVTTFLGGACAIRRSAYLQVGGQPEAFFYAHEETDLAWRLLGQGYRIEYDADTVMYHPQVPPTRHAQFYRLNARNRVWLARRNLPWPLAFVYLFDWIVLTLVRERSATSLKAWFRGFFEGLREPAGERRPMSWGTAWRMAKLGRPPIV